MKKSAKMSLIMILIAMIIMPFNAVAENIEEKNEEVIKLPHILDNLPYMIEKKILRRLKPSCERLPIILDLDEEITEKIKEMSLKYREEMIDLKSNIEKKYIDIERILRERKLNTKELFDKYKEIINLQNEKCIKSLEHKLNIYGLIPEEKKERAKEMLFEGHSYIRCDEDWDEFGIEMREFGEEMRELGKELKKIKIKIEEEE